VSIKYTEQKLNFFEFYSKCQQPKPATVQKTTLKLARHMLVIVHRLSAAGDTEHFMSIQSDGCLTNSDCQISTQLRLCFNYFYLVFIVQYASDLKVLFFVYFLS
jgi:hypothetical protein